MVNDVRSPEKGCLCIPTNQISGNCMSYAISIRRIVQGLNGRLEPGCVDCLSDDQSRTVSSQLHLEGIHSDVEESPLSLYIP